MTPNHSHYNLTTLHTAQSRAEPNVHWQLQNMVVEKDYIQPINR